MSPSGPATSGKVVPVDVSGPHGVPWRSLRDHSPVSRRGECLGHKRRAPGGETWTDGGAWKRGQLGPAKDGEELPERSATRPSGRKQTDRQIIGVRLGGARREPSPRKDGLREHRRL